MALTLYIQHSLFTTFLGVQQFRHNAKFGITCCISFSTRQYYVGRSSKNFLLKGKEHNSKPMKHNRKGGWMKITHRLTGVKIVLVHYKTNRITQKSGLRMSSIRKYSPASQGEILTPQLRTDYLLDLLIWGKREHTVRF